MEKGVFQQRKNMRTEISSDGTKLRLVFPPDTIAAVREANAEGTLTDDELLEGWLANSEFRQIGPEVCCDLTDAPIYAIVGEEVHPKLAQDMVENGYALGYYEVGRWDVSVHVAPVLGRWGWMHYAVQSMVGAVLNDGVIQLDGNVAPHHLAQITAAYPPIARARFRIESPDGTKYAGYNMGRGPYLTPNSALAYSWDEAGRAALDVPLYEKALGISGLVVRPYGK